MSSWLLEQPPLHVLFSHLSSSFARLSSQPLWRLSDNQASSEEEGGAGKRGCRVVRARCDVQTQGYLILSARGERLTPCLALGDQSVRLDSARDHLRFPPEWTGDAHTNTDPHVGSVEDVGGNEVVIDGTVLEHLELPVSDQTQSVIQQESHIWTGYYSL